MPFNTPRMSRRRFVGLSSVAVLAAAARGRAANVATGPTTDWADAAVIAGRIKVPVFPAHECRVTDFGASGDGRTDARLAFLEAVRRCNAAGGGRVVVPAGEWWLEGPIHLLSNVHVHLDDRAVLRFRTDDPSLYLPVVLTRWEGTEVFNYSPFIYAYQAVNVAITGGGLLDGNALDTFVKWRPRQGPGQQALRKLGAEGAPLPQRVFGEDHWLRPDFVQFFGCTNVLCDGFSLRDSPFWCVHAIAGHNITVRRLKVESAPVNSDGFDAESCSDVLVEDCDFNVGDDCVALKSGRDADGWRLGRPTENVVVRRCTFNAPTAGSGLAIGSEMSGGVRNVFVEDVRMGHAKTAINIKANLDRGGTVERVRLRRVTVEKSDILVNFTTDYHGYRGGQRPPLFRDFMLEDVHCTEADVSIRAVGVPSARLEKIALRNVTVKRSAKPPQLRHARDFRTERVLINGKPLVVSPDVD